MREPKMASVNDAETLRTLLRHARTDRQWRNAVQLLLSAPGSADEIGTGVDAFIPVNTSAVVGVFREGALWASLVVTLDADGSMIAATTVDGDEVELRGDMATVSAEVVDWVETHHRRCSLGLFFDKPSAHAFLGSSDKAAAIRAASSAGGLVLTPLPPALALALA
jgi:hypothetical protein